MTLDDAKKITQLLNAIVGEAGRISLQDEAALRDTTRTIQHHVGQLRQILDLTALVEQDLATARVLNKLQAVIAPGSQAAIALKLGRAELRKRGMALLDRESPQARTGHTVEDRQAAAVSSELPNDTTILLVEDDDQIRTLLNRMLSKSGYRVLQAGNGAEALDVATSHDGPIALLLTDVDMPDLDGFELRKRFRALHAATPVLYISGRAAASLEVQEKLKEFREPCLLKPFTETALNERIQAILSSPTVVHGRRASAA